VYREAKRHFESKQRLDNPCTTSLTAPCAALFVSYLAFR